MQVDDYHVQICKNSMRHDNHNLLVSELSSCLKQVGATVKKEPALKPYEEIDSKRRADLKVTGLFPNRTLMIDATIVHPDSFSHDSRSSTLLFAATQAFQRKLRSYKGMINSDVGEELHIANMEAYSAFGHQFTNLLKTVSKKSDNPRAFMSYWSKRIAVSVTKATCLSIIKTMQHFNPRLKI